MKYTTAILFSLFLCCGIQLTAQNSSEIYAVKLGQFINAKSTSFSEVSDLGYIYAIKEQGNVKNVFIGGIKGKAQADQAAVTAQQRGYIDASAVNLSAQNAEITSVIQLGVTDARRKVDWSRYAKAGRLFALVNGNQLKIMAGTYPGPAAAKAILPTIKRQGFADAFVKNVSSALIHEVTEFETGIFGFGGTGTPSPTPEPQLSVKGSNTTPQAEKTPEDYEVADTKIVVPPTPSKTVETTFIPPIATPLSAKRPLIRTSVKRKSVLELQKVLQADGTYNSNLDGYYGKGTKTAFQTSWMNNRQIKKYRALAKMGDKQDNSAVPGSLQYAINGLWDDTNNALLTLERSNAPVAKAYRAYWLYENSDNISQVDDLMNKAVHEAFAGKQSPMFDSKASYSYRDFDQLLQHLSYVQGAANETVGVPCWMFEKYNEKALNIFAPEADKGHVIVQDCGGFTNWEEIEILNTIADDISQGSESDALKDAAYRAKALRLFLAPEVPVAAESAALETWLSDLQGGVAGWQTRDPILGELGEAFNLAFYQSFVLLEDYFSGQGYNSADAKSLGLATLQAVLGTRVNRFM